MSSPLTTANPSWIGRLSVALALYALIGGAISFSGWAFDVPRLTDWLNDGISTQPNTAVLLICAGAALLLSHFGYVKGPCLLGAIVTLVGGLNLLQFAIGLDFGFNNQLMFGRAWGHEATVSPGRFGVPASISFILVGISIILLSAQRANLRRLVPILAMFTVLITLFSLLGYLFGARQFYAIPWLSAIALQTATMLLALAIGLIVSVPQHHPMLLLSEPSSAGQMARTVFPVLIVLIPTITWLRIKGFEYELFDIGTSRALGVGVLLLSVVAIMWNALLALRRRELRERESDQQKDEFLAILAHELRNPLAPISNALAITKLSPGDPETSEQAIKIIERQTSYLVRLVDDLLDLSRITSGKLELRRERIELSYVIDQAIETCTPLADSSDQDIVVQMPSHPIYLDADPVRLSQVLCNLLNNACKYSRQKDQIRLTVEQQEKIVVIRLRDNGIGIPRDMLSSIFRMFSQVDQSLEKSQGGLGVGLTLASTLANLHGGRIEAYSDGINKGCEFTVYLPISVDQTSTTRASDDPIVPLTADRILIADDNRDSADSLSEVLKVLGNQTFVAYDGEQAIAMAEAQRPDVILLDIGMPKLNGYDTCRQIRAFPWADNTLIVALTGWGQFKDRSKSAEAGFDNHLVKPINLAVLKDLLASRTQ